MPDIPPKLRPGASWMGETIKITSAGLMSDMAVRLAQAGAPWHGPLLRAAMVGDLRLCMVPPGSRLPLSVLDMERDRRPLVVVLHGDGLQPCGPEGFPQSRRLLRWAGFALLHGAGGLPFHYQIAVEAARETGRVVIAETTGALLPEWVALKVAVAPTTPGLIIAVPPGKPAHPCETAPAGAVVQ